MDPSFTPSRHNSDAYSVSDQSSDAFLGFDSYADQTALDIPEPIGELEAVSQNAGPSQSAPRQRQRRRHGPDGDAVKHKRTRSGCYTCRLRRVKCDETRPICDRCRKGNRECSFPPIKPSKKKSKAVPKASQSLSDSESNTSADLSEDTLFHSTTSSKPDIDAFDDPLQQDSTIDEPQRAHPAPNDPIQSQSRNEIRRSKSSELPKDVRRLLRYHKTNISHHHYALKVDSGAFMKTALVEIALKDPSRALVYAIVAFAAYHHTVSNDDMQILPFLSYYNESIKLLQKSLKAQRADMTTLLTILQLATIEEYLGDWVNLISHQRAAYQILIDLYTPERLVEDQIGRQVMSWYMRFDIFAGIMSGGQTHLSREWVAALQTFCEKQASLHPEDITARLDDYFATVRLLATDVTLLMGAKSMDAISNEEFVARAEGLTARFAEFSHTLDNAFTHPSCFVKGFPNAPPRGEDDIVDIHDSNFFYDGELFAMNNILIDFWGIDLTFKYQLALATRQPPPEELVELALKQCKMFEAMVHSEDRVTGAVLSAQASLAVASLFLPKDEKHTMWVRRKYALVEQKGYIYPPALRARASELWGIDVNEWWLPNNEGYPATVKAMRDFIAYRARNPQDEMGENIRDISGLFRSMDLKDDYGAGAEFDWRLGDSNI